MTVTNSVIPVSLKDGKCPAAHLHFRGAARDVYKYMHYLALKNGGFCYASIPAIARRTKKWSVAGTPSFHKRHVWRIIKILQDLDILSERQTVVIKGRTREGYQVVDHQFWAEELGDYCDVVGWAEYAETQKKKKTEKLPNVETPSNQEDEEGNVTADVTGDVSNDGLSPLDLQEALKDSRVIGAAQAFLRDKVSDVGCPSW
jgi:hypothetical protein